MANNTIQTFALPSPYEQQLMEAKRRQLYAEMLQNQANQSIIPQQGRVASKINPLAGVAQMLASGLAGYQRRKGEEAQIGANQADIQNAMSFMDRLQAGKPSEVSPDQAFAASMSSTPTAAPPNTPYSPQERQNYLLRGMLGGSPMTKGLAQMLMTQKQPNAMDYVNKIDAEKFTPESVAAFNATAMGGNPDFGKLQLKPEKPEKLTQTQIEQLQNYRDKLVQVNPKDPKIAQVDAMITKETTHTPPINVTYGAPVAGVDANGNPIFFQPSKEGGKPAIIPGVAPEKKQPNAEQANAAGFANRMESANQVINGSAFVPTPVNQLKSKLPFSSNFISSEQQKVEQAKRNFITAQLRKESGASISPSEFDTAEKIYFPQPGDSKEVIAQKAATRQQAIAAMQGASGNATVKQQSPAFTDDLIESLLRKHGVK